jgi:surfeit locus 1 family protein
MSVNLRSLLILIVAILGMLLTASLGRWQLSRAEQKENLQSTIKTKAELTPLNNSSLITGSSELTHQRAILIGEWLTESTVYLDNRQLNGKVGFFVYTPLQLVGSQSVIWVQRGWVPRNFVNRQDIPKIETISGMVTIEGRIAPPPSKLYEPGQADSGQIRQNLDLNTLTLSTGKKMYPLILQQQGEASEGMLRNWPNINLGVEKHYGYAFQWFGMCGLIAVLFVWFQIISPLLKRYMKAAVHD